MLIEPGGVLVCPSGSEYKIVEFEQHIGTRTRRRQATGLAIGIVSGYQAVFVLEELQFLILYFSGNRSAPQDKNVPVKYLSPFEYELLKTTDGISCKQ